MQKLLSFIAVHKKVFISPLLLIAVVFPFVVSDRYVLRLGTLCLMYIMLTLGLNLLHGFMGQMSFGQAAFWGIGAYTAAILIDRFGRPTLPAMLGAIIVAGVFGFLVSLPSLKLKGFYLSIVTMGFCEIIRLVELNWTSLTGGPLGMMNIPSFTFFGKQFKSYRDIYLIALVLVLLITIVVKNLVSSSYGRAIKAIRDDDEVAEVMGIDIVNTKRLTFVISAMIAGLAGAFYAQYMTFIHPSIFTTAASQEIIVMIIFGGLGSIPGTYLGTIVLTLLPELLRGLMQYRMLIYGVLMVVLMIAKPDGLLGNFNFDVMRAKAIEKRSSPNATGDKVKKA